MKYTKRQIREAISYWTKQLTLNEDGFNPDDPAADRNDMAGNLEDDVRAGEDELEKEALGRAYGRMKDRLDEICDRAFEIYRRTPEGRRQDDAFEDVFSDPVYEYLEDILEEYVFDDGYATEDGAAEALAGSIDGIVREYCDRHPEDCDEDGCFDWSRYYRQMHDEDAGEAAVDDAIGDW